jgi:hypothetical protein
MISAGNFEINLAFDTSPLKKSLDDVSSMFADVSGKMTDAAESANSGYARVNTQLDETRLRAEAMSMLAQADRKSFPQSTGIELAEIGLSPVDGVSIASDIVNWLKDQWNHANDAPANIKDAFEPLNAEITSKNDTLRLANDQSSPKRKIDAPISVESLDVAKAKIHEFGAELISEKGKIKE